MFNYRFLAVCYVYRLGEGCSHVAAILFKVEAAVRNGYTVCEWNQVFSKKVRANFLFGLTFYLYLLL